MAKKLTALESSSRISAASSANSTQRLNAPEMAAFRNRDAARSSKPRISEASSANSTQRLNAPEMVAFRNFAAARSSKLRICLRSSVNSAHRRNAAAVVDLENAPTAFRSIAACRSASVPRASSRHASNAGRASASTTFFRRRRRMASPSPEAALNLGPRFASVEASSPAPVPVPGPAMRSRTSLSTVCIFSINADSAGVGGRASARLVASPRAPPPRGVPNSRIRDAGRGRPPANIGRRGDRSRDRSCDQGCDRECDRGAEEGRVDESTPPGPRHEKDPSSAGSGERTREDAGATRVARETESKTSPPPPLPPEPTPTLSKRMPSARNRGLP